MTGDIEQQGEILETEVLEVNEGVGQDGADRRRVRTVRKKVIAEPHRLSRIQSGDRLHSENGPWGPVKAIGDHLSSTEGIHVEIDAEVEEMTVHLELLQKWLADDDTPFWITGERSSISIEVQGVDY